jgi:hypothetical protein
MKTKIIEIPGNEIKNDSDFHDIFSKIFGFPTWYGKNMDAWIDCMSTLQVGSEVDYFSKLKVEPGEILILQITHWETFRKKNDPLFVKFLDCVADVNARAVADVEKSGNGFVPYPFISVMFI